MASTALTSSWFTPTAYLSPLLPTVSITGTGAVEFLWSIGTPAGAAAGLPINAGVYQLGAPSESHALYFRVTSGSATLYYQTQTAALMATAKTGYAYSGNSGADEDFVQSSILQVGFDDLTTRAQANPYELAGYLTTGAVGLGAADDVFSAWLTLSTPSVTAGRTFRVYGIKYSSDQSANITDWDTLQNRTKTTAYTDFTTANEGTVSINITSIVEELQGVSGWSTDSPVQLFIEDTGSFANDLNTLLTIDATKSDTQVSVVLTSGLTPVPAEPL